MRTRKIRITTIIVTSMVIVCTLRFYILPHWLNAYILARLENFPQYRIHYKDLSISLLTASFTVDDLMFSNDSNAARPFFSAQQITISLDRKAVLNGIGVTKVEIEKPVISYEQSNRDDTQNPINSRWTASTEVLAVLPVNEISIHGGEIRCFESGPQHRILLHVKDIALELRNLQNVNGDRRKLSGIGEGTGKVMDARVRIDVELSNFTSSPMFRLSAELTELNLYDIRHFLAANGQPDAPQGLFSLFTQASTRNNKIIGYVKPAIEEVTMASAITADRHGNSRNVSETNGQSAVRNLTEINFEGTLHDGSITLWNAIALTLHNAFTQALHAMLEKNAHTPFHGSIPPSKRPKSQKLRVSLVDTQQSNGLRSEFTMHFKREKFMPAETLMSRPEDAQKENHPQQQFNIVNS